MRSSPFTGPRRSALLVALSLVAILSAAEGRAQVIFPEKISDFVTLNDTPGMGPCDWTRLNYNGGRSLFSLPANTAFVITSLQWSFSDALPYKRTSLKLIRGTGDPIHYTDGTYELLATVDGGNADAWGEGTGGQAVFPTGIVFGPGKSKLCWEVPGSLPHEVQVILQGYFVLLIQRAS